MNPTPLNAWASAVKLLADGLFPDRTDTSMYLKLYEETAEVIRSGGAPDEVADIFILWLDYAARKGIDLEGAIWDKLTVLNLRRWRIDENGVYHHVKV
jgi:hypothetical protein